MKIYSSFIPPSDPPRRPLEDFSQKKKAENETDGKKQEPFANNTAKSLSGDDSFFQKKSSTSGNDENFFSRNDINFEVITNAEKQLIAELRNIDILQNEIIRLNALSIKVHNPENLVSENLVSENLVSENLVSKSLSTSNEITTYKGVIPADATTGSTSLNSDSFDITQANKPQEKTVEATPYFTTDDSIKISKIKSIQQLDETEKLIRVGSYIDILI